MILLSDATLIESEGNYIATKNIMSQETGRVWMLETDATVETAMITSTYLLHMWKNGDMYIMKTDRPFLIELPDDDIRELSEWCSEHGWGVPIIHDRLLDDARGFDFWMRIYRAGIVSAPLLVKYEEEEMSRFDEIIVKKKEVDDVKKN